MDKIDNALEKLGDIWMDFEFLGINQDLRINMYYDHYEDYLDFSKMLLEKIKRGCRSKRWPLWFPGNKSEFLNSHTATAGFSFQWSCHFATQSGNLNSSNLKQASYLSDDK